MDKKTADEILAQMRQNYDNFAESFSRTRGYVPENVAALLGDFVKRGDRVVDIGCGNGRLYPFFKNKATDYNGIDASRKLIEIAADKYPGGNFSVGDALHLPFIADEFDLAVSLAVLHHIPSRECRDKFFQEAHRILRTGGYFIVLVWDLRLPAMIRQRQWKRLKSFFRSQIKIALEAEKMDFGDFFIPWQNKYRRYHHAFSLGELRGLAKSAEFEIDKFGTMAHSDKESNLYIIAKKI